MNSGFNNTAHGHREDSSSDEAKSNAPINQLGLGLMMSEQNGNGLLPSRIHSLLRASAYPAGLGLDSSHSIFASGQGSTLLGSQQHLISQQYNQNQVVQELLRQQRQMQQHEQQRALMAAVMGSSGVASVPTLTSTYNNHQLSALRSTLAARAQLALAHSQLTTPSMLQPQYLGETSATFVNDKAMNRHNVTIANPAADTKLPYFSDASKLHDHSSDEAEGDEERKPDFTLDEADDSSSVPKEKFPYKLYRMLNEAEKNGDDGIVSFFPHGRAFIIHKPRDFVADLMPKYFTSTRMSTFQRQLNLYGFRRITEGRDNGGFYHEYFLKGRKDLIKKIHRKKSVSRKARDSADVGEIAEAPSKADPFAAESRSSLDQILLNQQNLLQSQQQFVGPAQYLHQSTINSLYGFGRSSLPAMWTSGVDSETAARRLLAEASLAHNRSDLLSRSLNRAPIVYRQDMDGAKARTEVDVDDGDQYDKSD